MRLRGFIASFFCTLFFGLLAQNQKSTIINATPNKTQVIGNTYAIIVGVSEYRKIQSLQYASKDAETFKRLLNTVGNVPNDHIRMYLDSNTSKAAITDETLLWLSKRKIKKGDRIFFYLSGHGDAYRNTQFFFTHEADLVTGPEHYNADGNVNLKTLKNRLISEYVEEYGAEVFFIVDACRTTDATSDSLKNMYHRFNIASSSEKLPGFVTIYATKDGSVAYESPKFGGGHGLFTYFFIRGSMGEADMEPKDGTVTLEEISRYVVNSVKGKSGEIFPTEQQPIFNRIDDDDKEILFTIDPIVASNANKDYSLQASIEKILEAYAIRKTVTRTFTGKSDSLLFDTYKKFAKSIKSKQLLGSNSALMYYNALKKFWSNDVITEEAELMLITELINYSQTYVHLYLLGLDMNYIQTKANSKDPNALFYQDLSLISSSNFVLAAQYLETAIEIMGKTSNSAKPLYPKLWFLQARSYFDNPEETSLNTAIQLAEKALIIDTGAVHINHLLAMLELKRNNLAKAEFYFKKAIAGQSEYSKQGIQIGYEFFKLKRFQEASVYYRLHNVSDKQFAIAYNILALTSIQNGDIESGKRFLTLALSKDSSAEYLKNNVSVFYHFLARDASNNGQLIDAEEFYSIAAQNAPKNLFDSIMLNFGSFYFEKLKSFERAKNCYEKVLAISPNNIKALNDYAILYYMEGRNSRNVSYLDTAISISQKVKQKTSPNSPYYNLANQRIQNCNQAKEYIKMAH